MRAFEQVPDRFGAWLGDFLNRPLAGFQPPAAYSTPQLRAVLEPGDVLLVEGNLRISSLIKTITQSTWSHVALYVGPQSDAAADDPPVLIEAELKEGVILSPLSKYASFHTRICRAIGLEPDDRARVVAHALGRVGHQYDLKNVIDIARARLARNPLAETLKRGLQAFGSGEPGRVICSTLIAQAFQSVRYPILPTRKLVPCRETPPGHVGDCFEEAWEARHYSMFAPRDFDVSPYFQVVKPPPAEAFEYRRLNWAN